jgi:hypothetical protein
VWEDKFRLIIGESSLEETSRKTKKKMGMTLRWILINNIYNLYNPLQVLYIGYVCI